MTKPMEPRLRFLVWANGAGGPRAVAAFVAREHAELAVALLCYHRDASRRRGDYVAYLIADLQEHGGGALLAFVSWDVAG